MMIKYDLVSTKNEAIIWIHELKAYGIRPGLKRMDWLMERLDNPEQKVKFIHVAGTNGKGSTISFISEVLIAAGYNVGSFTSPYLIEFTNRIRINRTDISDEDLVSCLNQLIPLIEELAATELGSPTEFEVVTALAILYYSKQLNLDLVLWETGLGGRLDSTNIIEPLLTIITNIGYDHLNILGTSLSEIAAEKAGIIKKGAPLISGVLNPEAFSVVAEMAEDKGVSFHQFILDFQVVNAVLTAQGAEFDFRWMSSNCNLDQGLLNFNEDYLELTGLQIQMVGEYQLNNVAVALMSIKVLEELFNFKISDESIRVGLYNTNWPGRFEQLASNPLIVVDGAHNPDGARALVDAVSLLDYNRLILVLGVLHDKPIAEILEIILPIADEVITTEPAVPRRARAQDLQQKINAIDSVKPVTALADLQEALLLGLARLETGDLLLVSGSLYLIADARRFLLKQLEGVCTN